MKSEDDYNMGPCCACEVTENVYNIILLDKKAPIQGRGCGCVVCGLPADGAIAVLCNKCMEDNRKPKFACRGWPAKDGRIPIDELEGEHKHDLLKHRFEEELIIGEEYL